MATDYSDHLPSATNSFRARSTVILLKTNWIQEPTDRRTLYSAGNTDSLRLVTDTSPALLQLWAPTTTVTCFPAKTKVGVLTHTVQATKWPSTAVHITPWSAWRITNHGPKSTTHKQTHPPSYIYMQEHYKKKKKKKKRGSALQYADIQQYNTRDCTSTTHTSISRIQTQRALDFVTAKPLSLILYSVRWRVAEDAHTVHVQRDVSFFQT